MFRETETMLRDMVESVTLLRDTDLSICWLLGFRWRRRWRLTSRGEEMLGSVDWLNLSKHQVKNSE